MAAGEPIIIAPEVVKDSGLQDAAALRSEVLWRAVLMKKSFVGSSLMPKTTSTAGASVRMG